MMEGLSQRGASNGMLLRTPDHITRAIAWILWIRAMTYPTANVDETVFVSCGFLCLDRYSVVDVVG
jgi:hypothetical protein